ncbi:hypothetical protein, partial [Eubacterium aggregans]|uniref:hypothetical protein n=1 Tax=Eubacterium aggregans TaxID=81409 RepID=UPI003F382810
AGKIVVAKRLIEITISFNMPCFHTFFSISKAIKRFYCRLMAFVFALRPVLPVSFYVLRCYFERSML